MIEFEMALPKAQDAICESESDLHYRTVLIVEGLILGGSWAVFLLFLFAVALGLSQGTRDPRFLSVIIFGGFALLMTWIVVPKFRLARLRIYPDGFILPRKRGFFDDAFVPYHEIQSGTEISEDWMEIIWKGEKYSLTRRDYGKRFDTARAKIRNGPGKISVRAVNTDSAG